MIFLKNLKNLEKIKEKIIENKVVENDEIVFSTKYNFYTQNSIEKYNNQIAKINSWINQYNQKKENKKINFILKKLYDNFIYLKNNQIEKINNEEELFNQLESSLEIFENIIKINPYLKILSFLEKNNSEELKKIFVRKNFIDFISKKIFDDYHLYRELIKNNLKKENKEINFYQTIEFLKAKNKIQEFLNILKEKKEKIEKDKEPQNAISTLKELVKKRYIDNQILEEKLSILINLKKEISLFIPTENLEENLGDYYFTENIKLIKKFEKIYNNIRNFVTQSKENKNKLLISFNNPYLLTGWDYNKLADYGGFIIVKTNKENKKKEFYLGIILENEANKKIIESLKNFLPDSTKEIFYFIKIRQLPDPKKDLPRIVFSKKNEKKLNITEKEVRAREIMKEYKEKINNNSYPEKEAKILIDSYKRYLTQSGLAKDFGIEEIINKNYSKLEDFFNEIEEKCYKISFHPIDFSIIEKLNQEEKIILFKITSKDFRKKNASRDDLFTLYLKETLNPFKDNDIFRLNGNAKIFFRKASLEKNIKMIKDKKIISKKRFTENKFFIHLTISINENNKKNQFKNHEDFNEYFYNKNLKPYFNQINFLGIDRGENNLLYLCLIDNQGKIIFQKSLNKIKIGDKIVDFNEILTKKQKEKETNQKHWKYDILIKNFKKGYLSYAINEIVKTAYENNSLIILENLDFAFKIFRQKISKNIYQIFETNLINKLNYLVFKDKKNDEPAGILKGIQLVPPAKNYKEIKKPIFGSVIFVNSRFTSKIDPTTGFYKFLAFNKNDIDKIDEFIKGMRFFYDKEKDEFFLNIYTNQLQDFVKNKNILPDSFLNHTWTLRSNILRSIEKINKKNKKIEKIEVFFLTDKLKEFLKDVDNWQEENNILKKLDKDKKLYFVEKILFKIWFKLRNKINGEDHIISPVSSFNTKENHSDLPQSSDANGAYCIALKGMIIFKNFIQNEKFNSKIKNDEVEKLYIKNLAK